MVDVPESESQWIVKIALCWGYCEYDSSWMKDKSLPYGSTRIPDLDSVQSTHIFDTEQEALKFIKDWWSVQ
jgi:hypothetical protein